MSPASRYQGLPVSEGVAAGELYPGDARTDAQAASAGDVRAAFAAVARERDLLAQRLREQGRAAEAEIVTIGALIAADPALVEPAVASVQDGADARAAIQRSAATQAADIAALPNPDLAERAGDVRQIATAVIDHLAGGTAPPHPSRPFILVRREVDPADLITCAEAGLAGAVSVNGGASSHAAIIARGLGVPMLAGVDPEVLAAPRGCPAILDATAGQLIVNPSERELAAARERGARTATRAPAARPVAGAQGPDASPPPGAPAPLRTRDGQEITLLCNVASGAETRIGLAAGAAGVGLLRTEIPFVKAPGWPAEDEHRSWLDPVLSQLRGRPAVVRLLDFSGDKVPPFLADDGSGLAALLGHPRALGDQLRAVLRAGQGTGLAVMVPMVRTLGEVSRVRSALAEAAAGTGSGMPELGIMVEVAATAERALEFGPEVDFFSIGTNDLTSQVLGLGRGDRRAGPALAADPRVLGLIAGVLAAAEAARVKVSVCGDAAADPAVMPLLVGLGVRTLSVGAARVHQVADWVAKTDAGWCATLAKQALRADTVDQVWAQVRA